MMYAEVLDVDSWVRACFSTEANKSNKPVIMKCLDPPLAVLAVHRSTFANDSSWIALRVPLAKAAELGELMAAAQKFLLVMIEPPAEKSTCWSNYSY